MILEFSEGQPVAAGGGIFGDAQQVADGIEGVVFPEMKMDDSALLDRQNQESSGESVIEQGCVRIGGRREERLGFRVPSCFPGGAGLLLTKVIEDQPMRKFEEAASGRRTAGGSCETDENGVQNILGLRLIAQQIQRKSVDGSSVEIV